MPLLKKAKKKPQPEPPEPVPSTGVIVGFDALGRLLKAAKTRVDDAKQWGKPNDLDSATAEYKLIRYALVELVGEKVVAKLEP